MNHLDIVIKAADEQSSAAFDRNDLNSRGISMSSSWKRRGKQLMTAVIISFVSLLLLMPSHADPAAQAGDEHAQEQRLAAIKQYVHAQMLASNIPGLSLAMVHKGKIVLEEGFGYADLGAQKPVTSRTLFELGSTSKAFTGLAVHLLEEKGLLRRSDPITSYIPWLRMTYNGKPAIITLHQLLHHTSGIPFESIGRIPASEAETAMEQTVRALVDQPLARLPGSSFEYATINYDVLGFIIEKASGLHYEQFMRQSVFEPLGMTSTVAATVPVYAQDMAAGHKVFFGRQLNYQPPIYRGNTPAGYIVSSARDMARWMLFQLQDITLGGIGPSLITASHEPDRTVAPDGDGSYYASGWSVYRDKQEISHAGNNPAFSSFVALYPAARTGIAVLMNTNSEQGAHMGRAIMDIWSGKHAELADRSTNGFLFVDQVAIWITGLWGGLSLVLLFLTGKGLIDIRNRRRRRVPYNRKQGFLLGMHGLFVVILGITYILLLHQLTRGLPWEFVIVWSPASLAWAAYGSMVPGVLYLLYAFLLVTFRRDNSIITKTMQD